MVPELTEAAVRAGTLGARRAAVLERLEALGALEEEGLARAGELFELRERAASLEMGRRSATALLRGYGIDAAARRRIVQTGRLVLRSPEDGLVVERQGVPGAVYEPGGPPLLTVASLRPVRIEASLVGPVPKGVSVVFVAQDGRQMPVAAAPMSSFPDPSGRVRVWLRPEPPRELPDGLPGRLRVSFPEGAVEVPSAALRRRGGPTEVAVLEDGATAPRWVPVELLLDSGTSAVVRGELTAGTRVAQDAGALR